MIGRSQPARMRLPHRMSVRLAGLRGGPGAITWQPAPPVSGDPAIARRLAAGVLLFDGRLVESTAPTPWDIEAPDHEWSEALHGQDWLDHAAASDDPAVRQRLVAWVWDWIARYGDGSGPGWSPALIARRLTRWIAHSAHLLRGQDAEHSRALFRVLGLQEKLVSWRWRDTAPGADRIEALAGLVYASLSLEGADQRIARATTLLSKQAEKIIGADGAIASRNPEELARILSFLVWSAQSIEDAGLRTAPGHMEAIQRALPLVRALRHPSGAMARFQGGRAGHMLKLDDALAGSGPARKMSGQDGAMGYWRLSRAGALVIADGGGAPGAQHTRLQHASALAFEFSHDRQEIICNSGPGLGFGADAGVTSRRGPAHSMVELGDRCPGRLRPGDRPEDPPQLFLPGRVTGRVSTGVDGAWFFGESEQYLPWFGLRVERRLHIAPDGLKLSGEDTVLATTAEHRAKVAKAFPDATSPCPLSVRLHLHPDIRATTALNGKAIALTLPDDSRWLMTADADEIALEPSQHHDETRPKPRATSQIVVRSHVLEYWGRVTWSLERLAEGASPLSTQADRT